MGKATGFLEIKRQDNNDLDPIKRIKNFDEFHLHLKHQQRAKQGARCMDCGVPFCQNGKMIEGMVSGCPLNNLIPEWNDLIYHGNDQQALLRLLKTNNFPEFTARVCPALCEASCTCGLYGEPVTIKENEYGIIEHAFEQGWIQPQPPKQRIDKKIAIIGSGPAGLVAGDQLNKRGYHVTIYERDDRLGGLLMYGIPNMKLDKSVIERRIAIMKSEGIVFKTNAGIENEQQAKEILTNYDRVLLACGARKPRDLNVAGNKGEGIYFALDYLTKATKSLLDSKLRDQNYIFTKDKKVLVIGGGDTGNDCVATAIRLGCQSVIQLEMMPELPNRRPKNNPWPEWPLIKKTDYGQVESMAMFNRDPRLYQTTVKKFILDDSNHVKQAILVSLKATEDETGRTVMEALPGSEKAIDVDLVLIAAGFVGCQNHVAKAFGVAVNERGNVQATDYKTSHHRVFVAGDMHRGQSLVVWAIKEGREVSNKIDYDIMGYTNI